MTLATFALIHGAGDAGWYWHLVEQELRRHGHWTVAPDLPCDDDAAGLDDYADAVVNAVGPLDPHGEIVVVAQSFGGFTAPLVAARIPVDMLVLVTAMIPAPGEAPDDWSVNTGFDAVMVEQQRHFAGDDLIYHDVPPALAAAARQHARRQSNTPGCKPWPLDAWPSVDTRVVLCSADRFFPADFMRQLAKDRLGVAPDEIAAGHAVALARPKRLARLLSDYATEAG